MRLDYLQKKIFEKIIFKNLMMVNSTKLHPDTSQIFEFLAEMESRTQGSRPRPRTKDTAASVLRKRKERTSKKFFRQPPIYRRSQDFWLGRPKPQITCNDVIKNLPVGITCNDVIKNLPVGT